MNLKMFNIIVRILDHEGIPYEPITDVSLLMKHLKGRANPAQVCGVYAYPKFPKLCTIITNFYEAIDFIEKNGLKRI